MCKLVSQNSSELRNTRAPVCLPFVTHIGVSDPSVLGRLIRTRLCFRRQGYRKHRYEWRTKTGFYFRFYRIHLREKNTAYVSILNSSNQNIFRISGILYSLRRNSHKCIYIAIRFLEVMNSYLRYDWNLPQSWQLSMMLMKHNLERFTSSSALVTLSLQCQQLFMFGSFVSCRLIAGLLFPFPTVWYLQLLLLLTE